MSASLADLCQARNLLREHDGLVRVPFLVKGRLVVPPVLERAAVVAAFAAAGDDVRYLRLPTAQVLRERVIDRASLRLTDTWQYQVMPALDPLDLIETDFDALASGPYALPVAAVLDYLAAVGAALAGDETVDRVDQLYRATADYPDAYLDIAFAAFQFGLDPALGQAMIDQELGIWGRPGSDFLNGWVEVAAEPLPNPALLVALALPTAPAPPRPAPTLVRAMPTRQLHITAGNAPTVPLLSALRLLLTKSVGVIKLPAGAILPGALVALAALVAAPDHPLTRHLSVVYWAGGDEPVESLLFAPNAFDRVVVWGAPGAVSSVQARALFSRVISLNPRYGVSLIGQEAFSGDLEAVVTNATLDTMINNQKACTASFVHYVEGSEAQVAAYADCLRRVLAGWDAVAPSPAPPAAARGQLRRMQRGRYATADWRLNLADGEYRSGVVVMPDEFDILDHPLCRLVAVRRLDRLEEVLPFLHVGVSTVGVFPEARRLALRDAIAARGVSNVLPLGQCERLYPGMPHDGMLVLSELVDWKNG